MVLLRSKHPSSVHPAKFMTQPLSLFAAKSYRKQSAASTWKTVTKTYLQESSIHGLKYIVEDGVHWLRRALWVAAVALSLALAALSARDLWRTASELPTATAVASTHHPLSAVPFPAVTICSVNRVQASAATRFYAASGLASAGFSKQACDKFLFKMVDMVLPEDTASVSEDVIAVQNFLMAKNYTMKGIMRQLSQPCEEMALQCRWRGKSSMCKDLFSRHKTDSGYCCSFNYPYDRSVGQSTTSSNSAGLLSGLTVLLDPQLGDYQAATFSFYGFQVLVHAPDDFPDVIARGHIVKPAAETFLQVTAEQTVSTESVLRLPLQQRKCRHRDEGSHAARWPIPYSRSNCLVACRAAHMRRRCHCVPYFYPSTHTTTRECNLLDLPCLANNSWFFSSFQPDERADPGDVLQSGMSCDCFPGCFDVAYYLSATSGFLFQSHYDTTTFFTNITLRNHTILHIYFRELSAVLFQRNVVYDWNDLIGAFGGMASLFLGCSVLSVMELLDFFTIRLTFTLHQQLHKKTVRLRHPNITWLS